MLKYTDPRLVDRIETTAVPYSGRTRHGYGHRIPTKYLIRYNGRNYRVRMMQYANAGTAYITVKGEQLVIDTDTEHAMMYKSKRDTAE